MAVVSGGFKAMVESWMHALVNYSIRAKIIEPRDQTYFLNRLYAFFHISLPCINITDIPCESLEKILSELLREANDSNLNYEHKNREDDTIKDEIMNLFAKKPSDIERDFWDYYFINPQKATNWFYHYCCSINYVKKERSDCNLSWLYQSKKRVGSLELTINLAKPEKDPQTIALNSTRAEKTYPLCQLCKENEGNIGVESSGSRANLRTITLLLNNEKWYMQFSPYQYYQEHIIVFSENHIPMNVNELTIRRLLDFVDLFPQYFIGSNAGLPIVGGSILNHDHFQGGLKTFPIENAPIIDRIQKDEISISILEWPLTAIRVESTNREAIYNCAKLIMTEWKNYNNDIQNIVAFSDGAVHNATAPIVRKRNNIYQLYLILRNNRTDKDHPLGIFHPHSDVHHIKKENIGLIEAMGMAILPGRLLRELDIVEKYLNGGTLEPKDIEAFQIHKEWANMIHSKHASENIYYSKELIFEEVAAVFEKGLEDCAVFQQHKNGVSDLICWIQTILHV
jgi:UDPglucose--hexose-1-phosphate uridylyltransferase